jgi:hypothetical protein
MIDVLHQLLKGITIYLIIWVKTLVSNILPAVYKRKQQYRTIKESFRSVQLDQCFQYVPLFTGLKHFAYFSKIKQWTGVEQRAIIRQLILVIVLLLLTKVLGTMHYA